MVVSEMKAILVRLKKEAVEAGDVEGAEAIRHMLRLVEFLELYHLVEVT